MNNEFESDWASPPGDTIVDILEEKNILCEDFADSMGLNMEETTRLINGDMRINSDIANKLSKVLGSSSGFWENRDRLFVEDLVRLCRKLGYL